MARAHILGTAGHIDHGKTSLVKALTGVDTDRLPEEKARGITIDIGFAALDLGDFQLGVVDVPGHERFIKNMLAGATGIDLALLVVAADDSVMPQTREHLEILQYLGVRRGVIALTKADLVDDDTREVAVLEIRDLVRGTFLEAAPIIPTSAISGLGLDELKAALRAACTEIVHANIGDWFRLPIDRAFVLQGHGTVVTGSVVFGSVRVGDEIEWHKGDGTSERVRVRSLNNHGAPVEEIHRGQRGAVNLAGVPHEQVRRGQELARPGYLAPSRVLSVKLRASSETRRPIKHRLPVRLHLGTAEIMATVSVLDGNSIEPGQTGIVQLFLDEPAMAVLGQPFVLRDSSAEATLGGGTVLQPNARKLRRRQLDSLKRLEMLASEDCLTRATTAVWFAGFEGVATTDLVRLAGVPPADCEATVQKLIENKSLVSSPPLLHADRLTELSERILELLATLHAEEPLLTGHDRNKALARLDDVGHPALLQSIVDRLIAEKKIVGDARRIARADFKAKLGTNQRKLKDKIVAEIKAAGFTPPEPASFANLAGGSAKSIAEIFEVAAAEGDLVKITNDIFLHSESAAKMESKVREELAKKNGATVAEIRDWLGTTRKYAVPICEYLDRAGITRRVGDLRQLAPRP